MKKQLRWPLFYWTLTAWGQDSPYLAIAARELLIELAPHQAISLTYLPLQCTPSKNHFMVTSAACRPCMTDLPHTLY